jgi:hypothetical protein
MSVTCVTWAIIFPKLVDIEIALALVSDVSMAVTFNAVALRGFTWAEEVDLDFLSYVRADNLECSFK